MVEEVSIGPYRVVRRLGFGRTSEVLLATRRFPGDFERRVVIKRLLAPCEDEADRQAVLATEALAYARVAHPAIVQLFDFFSYDGHLALVLEYVDGPALSRLQSSLRAHREPMGDRVSTFIASRIFAALAAAHSARDPRTGAPTPVIHRDVSPENVFVPWDGFVKLGDFDLAKVIGVTGETRGGLLKGTYGYMAPEQVTGDAVTPRTDVYAGCLVLRELLLARPAFDESLPELELLRAMEASRLAPLESIRGGISRRLADAMRRGLARDPSQRTLSAAEMVDVLRAEGDFESAHAELIAILARHRPVDGRGSMSQLAPTPPTGVPALSSTRASYHTPQTMTFSSVPESVPPIESAPYSTRAPASARRRSSFAFAAALACVGLVAAAYLSLRPDAPPVVAASPPIEIVTPQPMIDTVPVTSLPSAPAAAIAPDAAPPASSSTTGEIATPASAHGHRVWVDGRVAAWSSGTTIRVPCGTHVVRIGSAGESTSLVVPCGGTINAASGRASSALGATFQSSRR
jgi:serine/threonine protein kinase